MKSRSYGFLKNICFAVCNVAILQCEQSAKLLIKKVNDKGKSRLRTALTSRHNFDSSACYLSTSLGNTFADQSEQSRHMELRGLQTLNSELL